MPTRSVFQKYGYFWITLLLFLFSLVGHWAFGWSAYQKEQEEHSQPAIFAEYSVVAIRDTFENWQSEFLQLIWQVAGLAYLLHVGSPQSKEGDERKEEKIDAILSAVDKNSEEVIRRLDRKYARK
jgi:hypothetical protein